LYEEVEDTRRQHSLSLLGGILSTRNTRTAGNSKLNLVIIL